jgi:hypothetical protein
MKQLYYQEMFLLIIGNLQKEKVFGNILKVGYLVGAGVGGVTGLGTGAVIGAGVGSAIIPGVGTVIGGGIGAMTGWIGGAVTGAFGGGVGGAVVGLASVGVLSGYEGFVNVFEKAGYNEQRALTSANFLQVLGHHHELVERKVQVKFSWREWSRKIDGNCPVMHKL